MAQILIPTSSAEDWKQLLAQPDLHWKQGYSAMTLARSWEAARSSGFPPEVQSILGTSGRPQWDKLRALLVIPEYKVPLPGGKRPSQTDAIALARATDGLVAIAVEGKVDESFGPTVGQKRAEESTGVDTRLGFLMDVLELSSCPDEVRYQLLHRTASAILIAKDFASEEAVMLVHSFSPSGKWFSDFEAFARIFGHAVEKGRLVSLGRRAGVSVHIGWCVGEQSFRLAPAGAG